jgi:hypothetical protein
MIWVWGFFNAHKCDIILQESKLYFELLAVGFEIVNALLGRGMTMTNANKMDFCSVISVM